MIKTYISALLVVFVVAAQMVHAQDNMDDVFAQLDAGSGADDAAALETMEPEGGMTSAEVESGEEVQAVPEEETLALLKEKGAAHYKAGKYDEAIRMFDAMLAIDEYNADALAYRKRAARRIASKETKKQGASRAQAFADVKGAWNAAPKVLGKVDVGSGAEADPEQIAIDQMVARLKAINIPVLDFDNTGIEDVVLYLTESSRKLDSAGKGVNILLVGMDSAEGARNVTTVITDINLFDALQVVSEMASLKFEVKSGAVAIMPANYVPVSAMVMQSYDIVPEVGQDLEAFSGDAGGSVDDLFGDSSQSAAQGPVDVAGFFSIVEFPEGASAIYRPRFHKLFVKNTPENLKAVEAVLADLDDRAIKRRSQQVEIEAKFVEFNEGSLEELGFDWTVYGSGSIAGFTMKDGSYFQGDSGYTEQINTLPAGSGPLYTSPVNGQSYLDPASNPNMLNGRQGQNFFGSGQRNNGDVGGGGIGGAFEALQSGLLTKMGGAPASMLFSNGDVDLQISAMATRRTMMWKPDSVPHRSSSRRTGKTATWVFRCALRRWWTTRATRSTLSFSPRLSNSEAMIPTSSVTIRRRPPEVFSFPIPPCMPRWPSSSGVSSARRSPSPTATPWSWAAWLTSGQKPSAIRFRSWATSRISAACSVPRDPAPPRKTSPSS
jgi:general secretion pathway protein D